MSAPVYVIREGKVRGQGKYLQSSVVGPPWGDAQSAARFDSREEANDWIDPWSWSRIVALVPRKVVSLSHHTASVAMTRLAALEEAERVCLNAAMALARCTAADPAPPPLISAIHALDCVRQTLSASSSAARRALATLAIAALKVLP